MLQSMEYYTTKGTASGHIIIYEAEEVLHMIILMITGVGVRLQPVTRGMHVEEVPGGQQLNTS